MLSSYLARFIGSGSQAAALCYWILLGSFGLAPSVRAQSETSSAEDQMISPADLRGNERIWGVILFASDEEIGDDKAGETASTGKRFRKEAVDSVLEKVRKALPEYRGFKVLGAHDQKVLREYATWITPSADFFLAIDSKGRAKEGDGINIYLQLWNRQIEAGKEDKVLLKSDAVLKRSNPLIIEGPEWRDGRVIFVLMLEYEELFAVADSSSDAKSQETNK